MMPPIIGSVNSTPECALLCGSQPECVGFTFFPPGKQFRQFDAGMKKQIADTIQKFGALPPQPTQNEANGTHDFVKNGPYVKQKEKPPHRKGKHSGRAKHAMDAHVAEAAAAGGTNSTNGTTSTNGTATSMNGTNKSKSSFLELFRRHGKKYGRKKHRGKNHKRASPNATAAKPPATTSTNATATTTAAPTAKPPATPPPAANQPPSGATTGPLPKPSSEGSEPTRCELKMKDPRLVGLRKVKEPKAVSGPPCKMGYAHNPDESWRKYSSVAPGIQLNSTLHSSNGWVPSKDKKGEWVQIDLGVPNVLLGLIMQGGNAASSLGGQWVSELRVSYSFDGEKWKHIAGIWPGVSEPAFADQAVEIGFEKEIQGVKYVKIIVEKWNGIEKKIFPALRVAALVKNEPPPMTHEPSTSTTTTTTTVTTTTKTWSTTTTTTMTTITDPATGKMKPKPKPKAQDAPKPKPKPSAPPAPIPKDQPISDTILAGDSSLIAPYKVQDDYVVDDPGAGEGAKLIFIIRAGAGGGAASVTALNKTSASASSAASSSLSSLLAKSDLGHLYRGPRVPNAGPTDDHDDIDNSFTEEDDLSQFSAANSANSALSAISPSSLAALSESVIESAESAATRQQTNQAPAGGAAGGNGTVDVSVSFEVMTNDAAKKTGAFDARFDNGPIFDWSLSEVQSNWAWTPLEKYLR